jgi:hydroxymethylpyrimidine/phosphomethylpyrimidine kinase
VALDPQLVQNQIEAVLDDFPVGAVKTGALGHHRDDAGVGCRWSSIR